jgi:drug/metabolite transporter (DMT)-like permease
LISVLLTLLALIAFATNSILCRSALLSHSIGPLEFASIRLSSGIIALLPILLFRRRWFGTQEEAQSGQTGSLVIGWPTIAPAAMLFSYALFFSLAYVQLSTGTGALILFASVQMTMMGITVARGTKVLPLQWVGMVVSFGGLLYLLSPGLSAPSLSGAILMVIAGMSWGIYSVLGRREPRAVIATARNFLFCLPGVVVLAVMVMVRSLSTGGAQVTSKGVLLAMASGAVASGMGYVLWYVAVKRISTATASVAQLLVPVLAAMGGVLFLHESLTVRLAVALATIAGGVALTIVKGKR